MNEEYNEVERQNSEAAIHSHDREDDEDHEVIPEDDIQEDTTSMEEKLEALETDVDLRTDNPSIRFALYSILKDTRGEPGLSLENVANVILDALTREEAQAVRNELARKLDL